MKRFLIRVPILLIVFIASVALFSKSFNTVQTVDTTDFTASSMPVLYMKTADTIVNPMYGYTKKMTENTIRDGITPMDTDRKLTVVADVNQAGIKDIAYTVTTPDMEKIVEEENLSLPAEMKDQIEIDFSLEEPILMNQEYLIRFTVTLKDDTKLYYYGRLLQKAGLNTTQYLNFVQNFYETATNKEAAKSLTTYLESDSNSTSTDLSYVDITGTYKRITWGDLSPQIAQKAVPVIDEINETTCSITMNYVISSVKDEETTENFYVTEYYRMRYASSRVMLLNFDRSTVQLMNMDQLTVDNDGILLGITDEDENMVTDPNADIAVFEQAGELYAFNRSACRLTKIFTFRTSDELDMRELNQNHKIKIIRVDETGNVDFCVYGYMNSDRYEGQNGIAVYHYDASTNVTKEEMFVPSTVSVDCMDQELTGFSYITTTGIWYFRLNDKVYKVDLESGESETLLDGIKSKCFVASSSEKSIAWADNMEASASRSLTMMDLESGKTHKVSVGDDEYVRALGFLNEDLIYGVAKESDIKDSVFAMKTVYIENFSGDIVKKYAEKNRYVISAEVTKEYIEMKRVKKNDSGKYKSAQSDRIINNEEMEEDTAELTSQSDDRLGNAIYLTFSKNLSADDPVTLVAKYSTHSANEDKEIAFKGFADNTYQVYYHGALQDEMTSAKKAILKAEKNYGTVLDYEQQYVWERGNKKETAPPNLDSLPQDILSIPTSVKEMQSALGDDYTAIDLTGCELSDVLYFVSRGNAVAAKTDDGYTLIVGYDYYNVLLYDPETKDTYYGGMNDSTALFAKNGNHFITYIEKFKE